MSKSLSMTAWYVRKAEKCAQMAKNATDLGDRVRWATEARLWREIGADIEKDFELHPGPPPKSGRGRGGTGDAR
jgi:hypothetical protein